MNTLLSYLFSKLSIGTPNEQHELVDSSIHSAIRIDANCSSCFSSSSTESSCEICLDPVTLADGSPLNEAFTDVDTEESQNHSEITVQQQTLTEDDSPELFNDTLEETRYLMEKGNELKAVKNQITHSTPKTLTVENCAMDIPNLKSHVPKGPSAGRHLLPKRNNLNEYDSTVKPMQRSLSNATQKGSSAPLPGPKPTKSFKHVVSPIRTYIKSAPRCPLQSTIHCHDQNLIAVLRNNYGDRKSRNEMYAPEKIDPASYKSSIPMKNMINSTCSQTVDARKPVCIPGGQKIRKLIDVTQPTLTRHKGRVMKNANHGQEDAISKENVPENAESSACEMSLRMLETVKQF